MDRGAWWAIVYQGHKESDTIERRTLEKYFSRDFPGGPVVRAAHFHCRRHGFDPWSGN